MDSCDVLIVGGGPAGSSCAWGLRSSGLRVIILDKARFPRNKVCGGWITPPVLEALGIAPGEYSGGRTLQPITGFRIGCMGQADVGLAYRRVVSYGIRRSEFDEFLLRRSQAELREAQSIESIEASGADFIVNGEIRTRLLVGAGGHFCPVSRFMGNSNHEQPVVAQEIEFQLGDAEQISCAIQGEIPELYFCRDLLGYGWCFRKGNFLNIGLGRMDQGALPDHVKNFLRLLRDSGRIRSDPPARMCGHAYLLAGYSPRKLVSDSALLIGDSAGLAYPQSGEGILPAVESGLAAAQVIRSAHGRYDRAHLQPYADRISQQFSKPKDMPQRIAAYLPRGLRNAIARALLRREQFCREVVIDNWFLHLQNGHQHQDEHFPLTA